MITRNITCVVSHTQRSVKQIPPPHHKALFILNRHNFRSGYGWPINAEQFKIEVRKSPAQKPHCSKSCDNGINLTFKFAIRDTHDFLKNNAFLDFSQLRICLKLTNAGYKSLTKSFVQKAFRNTRMRPMHFYFHT